MNNQISVLELQDARQLVDSVLGTSQVDRPVEITMISQWRGHEFKQVKFAIADIQDVPDRALTAGAVLFWQHVADIGNMLESDGSLYHAGVRQYFTSAKRIAAGLVDMGHVWATANMVKEAQSRKKSA